MLAILVVSIRWPSSSVISQMTSDTWPTPYTTPTIHHEAYQLPALPGSPATTIAHLHFDHELNKPPAVSHLSRGPATFKVPESIIFKAPESRHVLASWSATMGLMVRHVVELRPRQAGLRPTVPK